MPFSVFKRKPLSAEAARAYDVIVAQARQPYFYLEAGVPDTLDGRFDLIVLHAFLVMHRSAGHGAEAEQFNQALFDIMFKDMEANLRTIGVSDLRVGKKVKQMAQAFYGRSVAYREALKTDGDDVLAEALRRNLYRQSSPSDRQVAVLADYLRDEVANLAAQPLAGILGGRPSFGQPVGTSQ